MALGPVDRSPPEPTQVSSQQMGPRIPSDGITNDEHQFLVETGHGPVVGETSHFGPMPGHDLPAFNSVTKTGADTAEVRLHTPHPQTGQLQVIGRRDLQRENMTPLLAATTLGLPAGQVLQRPAAATAPAAPASPHPAPYAHAHEGATPNAIADTPRLPLDEVNRVPQQHAEQAAGNAEHGIPLSRQNSVDGLVAETTQRAQASKMSKTSKWALNRFDKGLATLNAKPGRTPIDADTAKEHYRDVANQKQALPAGMADQQRHILGKRAEELGVGSTPAD